MSKLKNSFSDLLRKTSLLYTADYIKFIFQKIKNFNSNRKFKKRYPSFALPPDYFLYETFSLNYHQYMYQGKWMASEIIDIIKPLTDLSIPGKKILDWGCGPARVVRFLPELLTEKHLIYGTDYNEKYIDWCNSSLKEVNFKHNKISPPLDFENNCFDVIYSISILTHLSEKKHYEWINEILRVMKPGGILIITTQGKAFKDKMLNSEILQFEKGEIVVRNFFKEGHRIFSAFQPEEFMIKLLKNFEIITCQKGIEGNSICGLQDTWIAKKKNIID